MYLKAQVMKTMNFYKRWTPTIRWKLTLGQKQKEAWKEVKSKLFKNLSRIQWLKNYLY